LLSLPFVSSASAAPVTLPQSPFAFREQQAEKLLLCADCSNNYEREASTVKAEADDAEGPRAGLPAWLVPDRPPQPQHKVVREEKQIRFDSLSFSCQCTFRNNVNSD
jgi:hypothetical protein